MFTFLQNTLILFLISVCFKLSAADSYIWRQMPVDPGLDAVVVDDFEERIKWTVSTQKAIPYKQRFVERNPGEKDEYGLSPSSDLFEKDYTYSQESAKLNSRPKLKASKYAAEFLMQFPEPGIDQALFLIPHEVHNVVQGRPLAMSIWIYGYGKNHSLYAVISNSQHKKMKLKLSSMNFYGWKRIEVQIPISMHRRNRKTGGFHDFRIDGLLVASHRKEKPGHYNLIVDLIEVLVDKSENYSGQRIIDNWK